jgi:hypothetical protein
MTKRSQKPPVYSTFSIRVPDGVKTRADVAAARSNLSVTTLIQDLLIDTFPPTSALDGPLSRLAGGYDPDSEPGNRLNVLADIRKALADLLPLIDAEEKKARKDLSEAVRKATARIDAANGSDQEPS